ncbi:hypothetical protein [Aquimarina litoralis]|uniref:hypothetical protein n=1 Tax=Aquimarina litoralis TaxID=584605 RepID=UPI001C596455|nr:hypothetical protein [Aquimarina litoralis]MBW1299002.1 hypothetical protein [Aquimarina litoralis]
MKKAYYILILVTIPILYACQNKSSSKESEKLKRTTKNNDTGLTMENPYLGQKPPGLIPEPFAPGLVTTSNWEVCGTFTPDMKSFYFIRDHGPDTDMEFVVFEYKNKSWQERVVSKRVGQPFISPDGKTMHLGRRYKERTENGEWSEIKKLDTAFQEIKIMRLTTSSKGMYVFDEIGMPDGDGVIRYSRLINGKRETPKDFGKQINTGKMNAHPFIAPDESYLIWDGRREDGYGHSDIYISFKQEDGSWGEAINMGDQINTAAWEAGASVTPDGKYLIFNRNVGSDKYENVDVYWVDAQVIENLRPKKDNNISTINIEGPYLGQKPPGLTPEPFAPGIITTKGVEDGGVFTHNMNEFHFIRKRLDNQRYESVIYKLENNQWSETTNSKVYYPFFAPNGETMHVGKRYKERTATGWSDTRNLGDPFEEIDIMSLSVSSKGTYVFDERRADDSGLLRYSRLINGKREAPRLFGKNINSGTRNSHPFIAPDESYMIWDGIKDSGFGNVDLYISFRQKDGTWGASINMGDKINTEAYEAGPKVTPDGKYLFFVRVVNSTAEDPYADIDIFWADARIIETLRPKTSAFIFKTI